MRVAFLYNCAQEDPAQTAEDDIPARSPVVAVLRRLGCKVTPVACTLDLNDLRHCLDRVKPDVVFNRVESLGGSDAMMAAVTLLLDTMQIPYTGCRTESLLSAASKLVVKERLVRAGLPTPPWITIDSGSALGCASPQPAFGNRKFILKSVFEHASFKMDDACVVDTAAAGDISSLLHQRMAQTGRPFFAEQFIKGREFNLSLLGDEPQVLPPAEIDFSSFPDGKPQIVGHGAKWDGASFEFHNTPRRFDFPPAEAPLLRRLSELAIECWRLFDLRGYARVDIRCDEAGQPWILEVNTNPCISPNAGFAAALERAGIGYDGGIRQILNAALQTGPPLTNPRSERLPLTVC